MRVYRQASSFFGDCPRRLEQIQFHLIDFENAMENGSEEAMQKELTRLTEQQQQLQPPPSIKPPASNSIQGAGALLKPALSHPLSQ